MLPNESYLPSRTPYRSRGWLAAVHQIESCVLCGAYGVQAAHSNQDRGRGQKASDCLTAAICPACHHEIDNGKELTGAERRARLDRAIVKTIDQLARRGLIDVRKP